MLSQTKPSTDPMHLHMTAAGSFHSKTQIRLCKWETSRAELLDGDHRVTGELHVPIGRLQDPLPVWITDKVKLWTYHVVFLLRLVLPLHAVPALLEGFLSPWPGRRMWRIKAGRFSTFPALTDPNHNKMFTLWGGAGYLWDFPSILWVKRVSRCLSSWYFCRSWVRRLQSVLRAFFWNTSPSDWSKRSEMTVWRSRQAHKRNCWGTSEKDSGLT